jgi:hypothetical protein
MFIVNEDKNHKENPRYFKLRLWTVPPVPAFAGVCGLPAANKPKAGTGNRCNAAGDVFVRR